MIEINIRGNSIDEIKTNLQELMEHFRPIQDPKQITIEELPKTEPIKEDPGITMDDARAKVAAYVRVNGNSKLKEVLKEMGYKKISAIPEKQLPEALEKMGVL